MNHGSKTGSWQRTVGGIAPKFAELNDGVIEDLLMFCQLSFPVFFNNFSDFGYPFDHKHPGIPEVVFGTVPVIGQKRIILWIKGIYGVRQARKI